MLSTNQVLQEGRYRIVGQFGQAESGVIYQAFDTVLNTKVIIKETVFDASAQPSVAKQLEDLATIKHESFMQVHGYFSEVNQQYLVTESVDGENLQALLEKNKRPFLLFNVLNWTEQMLDALIYLHSQRPPIIHRGVTPHNLTLTQDNKVKLLNSAFNLTASEWQNKSFSSLRLPYASLELLWDTLDPASQKVILNSYEEKSAEVLELPIDERSDVYALGATVYYLVTSKVPVDALERSIDLLEGKEDPLANPSKVNLQIPRNVSAFLLKSLEIKRENRFESAVAMRQALQPMLELMKKVERETQKALENPQVREAALREVELARENLRRQRETEALHKSQESAIVAQNLTESPKVAEPIKPPPAPISQGAFLEEIEKAKQNLQQQNEAERLSRVPTERIENVVAQSVSTPPAPTFEAEEVEKSTSENSVLVATAPTSLAEPPLESFQIEEDELFASVQPKSGKSWLIPAVLALVVLAVGGFFGFKFLGSKPTETTPEAVKQNAVSENGSNKSETSEPVNSETPAPVNNQTTTPAPTAETPAIQPVLSTEDKTKVKKVTTPTPAPVEKKATPAVKSPTPKKKELTVDDIIN